MSSDTVRHSYDETPYPDGPHFYTHPDSVGTTASLFGLDPAPADRCRVLEIGCASGVNLMAMAQYLPESWFVGIDLSPVQIAAGRELAAAAGLANVALHARAVEDLPADAGEFDYVLCHGVYSWVPSRVQSELLAAVKRHLAPGGVGYISYNTLPGWHFKRIVRDVVRFAGRKGQGEQERFEAGFGFLKFLLDKLSPSERIYYKTLQRFVPPLWEASPSYLVHEYLDEFNSPVYFIEFAAALAEHGLQYFSEATPDMELVVLPREVKEMIARWSDDTIQAEQALDFSICRMFRRSLVCHAGANLSPAPHPEVMRRYHYSATARPVQGPKPIDDETNEKFEILWDEAEISTTDPLVKAIVYALGQVYPQSLDFRALHRSVSEKLSTLSSPGPVVGPEGESSFAAGLLVAYAAGLLRPHRWKPAVAAAVAERPRATAFNRHAGQSMGQITNPYHVADQVGDFERVVLGLCDGNRDRAMMTAALEAKVRAGEFGPKGDVTLEEVLASLPGCVDDCLHKLQTRGLFLPDS
ncbi:MAG TPA: methyltransferase regulatory domain-containing protein [Gemmataceae bacterium]|nr:methyltransferase regulatory domain-containing protein [Gemmataceae bacterium]